MHKLRENRKPLDSTKKFHTMLNTGFTNVFGIPLRSSAFFCVQDKYVTSPYGITYECFPNNNYTYYFSNYIYDAFIGDWLDNDKTLKIANKNKNIIAYILLYMYYNKNSDTFRAWLQGDELKYTILSIDTPNIIKDSKNIWKTFLKENTPEIQKYIKLLEKTYPDAGTEFVKTFYKKTKDLSKIENDAEIMVYCEEMYMINIENESYKDIINEILEG